MPRLCRRESFSPHPRTLLCLAALALFLTAAAASADAFGEPGVQQGIVPAFPLEFVEVVDGLSAPVAMRQPPGATDERFFIVQQTGVIVIADRRTGAIQPTPFLDLSSFVSAAGELGLLSLAFHPNYDTNGYVYVNYAISNSGGPTSFISRIVRYTRSAGDPDQADPASAFVILEVDQDFSNHNGGDLHFGPDGYLYASFGDGGSGGDPNNRAQDGQSLLGKLLRLDVDGGSPYAVPADNPFVGNAAVRDEIWSLGLRNPWRFSVDRETGDLLIGDVGQNAVEEISFAPAGVGGQNFGWRCREGDQIFSGSAPCNQPLVFTEPIIAYTHESGAPCGGSVTGGFRYRGSQPALQGLYLFGDF
ncbi:MAG: PQQ-dependent sugar dehydrogenase, partial [Acidobacteriota bacterium]